MTSRTTPSHPKYKVLNRQTPLLAPEPQCRPMFVSETWGGSVPIAILRPPEAGTRRGHPSSIEGEGNAFGGSLKAHSRRRHEARWSWGRRSGEESGWRPHVSRRAGHSLRRREASWRKTGRKHAWHGPIGIAVKAWGGDHRSLLRRVHLCGPALHEGWMHLVIHRGRGSLEDLGRLRRTVVRL